MKGAKVSRAIFEPKYHTVNEEAPKYLYGDTKSGLLTNSTNSILDDCSPFSDAPDFCEKASENNFFALRIEPTSPLVFSALPYRADRCEELKKDCILFYIEKGKTRKMSEFNCMPMVLVRDKWEEYPELIGLEVKQWRSILAKKNLHAYPCHGFGTEEDIETWFKQENK